MTTGTMSASTTQNAKIAQARQARLLVKTVATTMPSTANKDAHASQEGGEENA